MIAGDSLIGGLEAHKMSAKRSIKVRSFSGATVIDMVDYLKPLLRRKPDRLLLQIGTNDCPFMTAGEIVNDMQYLKAAIKSLAPHCTLILCEIPLRTDDRVANSTRQEVNAMLDSISDCPSVSNSNIVEANLSKKGLHLNLSGTRLLAVNLIQFLKGSF